MKKTTFAVIVGNRDFFPDALVKTGRQNILDVLKKAGYGSIALGPRDTKYGAVETFQDALKCAALFASRAADIDGIIVTLPNFGDEKGVAETIKRANLNVPVLIHAEPDIPDKMAAAHRADSFCGKISVCDNLCQAGIPFTLTKSHTVKAKSAEFKGELADFAAVCRIVRGLRNVRFGAIGARTGAFNSVRYSEKILESAGIAVETLDMSEVFGRAEKLCDDDKAVGAKINKLKKYVPNKDIPRDSLLRLAKFSVVVDDWVDTMQLDGTAIQCWTSVQEYCRICICPQMSMMNEAMVPSACEVDVAGLLGMYILQLASETPSALLDWNNNYADDPNKCVLFHCSAVPKSFLKDPIMEQNDILSGVVGKENAYAVIKGRIKSGPATYFRTNTDDAAGVIAAYVGEGRFTNDKCATFGGYGVMDIPNLQMLMQYICRLGFAHHVAISLSQTAAPIAEALETYLDWDVYHHA